MKLFRAYVVKAKVQAFYAQAPNLPRGVFSTTLCGVNYNYQLLVVMQVYLHYLCTFLLINQIVSRSLRMYIYSWNRGKSGRNISFEYIYANCFLSPKESQPFVFIAVREAERTQGCFSRASLRHQLLYLQWSLQMQRKMSLTDRLQYNIVGKNISLSLCWEEIYI